MSSEGNLKSIIDKANSMDLSELVYTLYGYRANRHNLSKCRVIKNEIIQGKKLKHIIDIYVEFRYMNNLERTVIKIIDGKDVIKEDIWNFDNLLDDLGFYPKGVLYYNRGISDGAKRFANKRKIEVIYFDILNESINNIKDTLKELLPNGKVIGDPFWTIMGIEQKTYKNTGLYYCEDSIFLFTSKKAAEYYLSLIKNKSEFGVFGLTQMHLSGLIHLLKSQGILKYLFINYSSNQTLEKDNMLVSKVKLDDIEDKYMRK